MTYHLVELVNFRLNTQSGSWWNMILEMERQAGDHFSFSYPKKRPTRQWCQKYLCVNQVPTRLLE